MKDKKEITALVFSPKTEWENIRTKMENDGWKYDTHYNSELLVNCVCINFTLNKTK